MHTQNLHVPRGDEDSGKVEPLVEDGHVTLAKMSPLRLHRHSHEQTFRIITIQAVTI